MVKNNNHHIYLGLGALSVVLLSAFVVYKTSKSFKKGKIKPKSRFTVWSVFDSPDLPGSGNCMDRRLIFMLQQLEVKTGYPIFSWVNSGVRSSKHNRRVGGVSNSSHLIPVCKAVDIKTPTISIRNHIVVTARDVGFKRIGVGKTFVHLDVDTSKSQYVAWGYPNGTPAPVNPFV